MMQLFGIAWTTLAGGFVAAVTVGIVDNWLTGRGGDDQ